MKTYTSNLVPITEANQNFSQVARKTDKLGHTIILKNNKPKYYISKIDEEPYIELSEDEKVVIIAQRILKKYKLAFQELAKWLNSITTKYYYCNN